MSESAESKTFKLSRRLSVEITVGAGGMVVEWEPEMPEQLTAKELRRYRAARAEMVGRLSARMGGAVVVVERYDDGSSTSTRPSTQPTRRRESRVLCCGTGWTPWR